MKLSSFNFDVPPRLIASHPTEFRDECRLMVIHKATGKIEHRLFKDLLTYFDEDDTLVINDTKVFSAKLYGKKEKTDAKIEVFLLRELKSENHQWDTLVDPARKIRVGNKLYFGNVDLVAEVSDNTTSRGRTLKFLFDGNTEELYKMFEKLGETPIPALLNRNIEPEDNERYQTVYAKHIGAVTVPSAGLHFTPYLLKLLELKGISVVPITLHNSLGMLGTVNVEDLTKYKRRSEYLRIDEETAQTVNQSLKQKKQICVVGASSMKALESSVSSYGTLNATETWTNKFIFPPYDFKLCTSLITNFHLPKSILLMNAAAFGGYDLIMEAYKIAIKEKYRFFVYGDAMLII